MSSKIFFHDALLRNSEQFLYSDLILWPVGTVNGETASTATFKTGRCQDDEVLKLQFNVSACGGYGSLLHGVSHKARQMYVTDDFFLGTI